MRAILFVNGSIFNYEALRRLVQANDYLVGVDGGTLHCLAIDRLPHVVVGDLDSLDATRVEQLVAQGVTIERHPPAKDQTDLELAIERAIKDGAVELILVGASGSRLDQTLANLLILAQRDWPAAIKVLNAGEMAQVLRCGQVLTLTGKPGTTVSVLPLTQRVTGITYTGMEYPLVNASLRLGSTRGISNQIKESPATVTIKSGILLVVYALLSS